MRLKRSSPDARLSHPDSPDQHTYPSLGGIVSNENPFVAPGTEAGAALQAPPVEQSQAPQFGAAPVGTATAPDAAHAPYGAPYPAPGTAYGYAGIPAAPPQPVKANRR